jgi:hypothetical protein
MLGVAVRVFSRTGDDLGIAHVPPAVELGDLLDLGHGTMLPLRVLDVVETRPQSAVAVRCGWRRRRRSSARGLM